MPSDLRTQAIILRRTNYGESDRILNLLTPEGKIAVLARSVRKEKSRLAGGIELFAVTDVTIHRGKSALGTLTGAKMLNFYGNIITELPRLELASDCLKRIDRLAEQADNPEYFDLLHRVLRGLHQGLPLELVRAWAVLNLARATGEEVNLMLDCSGQPLMSGRQYSWDGPEQALRTDPQGRLGENEIKFARLLLVKPLSFAARITAYEQCLPALEPLVRNWKL